MEGMRRGGDMQRYFRDVKNKDQTFTLSKEDSYHIQKVMRMNIGEEIEIVYNGQVHISKIIELTPLVTAKSEKILDENNELSISVTLVQSLVKEQKMDYILQKATELGVSAIYPYQAERSLVKAEGKKDKKKLRWQTIVKEASEQSKRNKIPEVGDVLTLSDLTKMTNYDLCLLCTVNEKEEILKKVLSKCKKGVTMIVIVGPEGGFTDNEEAKLMASGFIPVSLGKSVLRTETASSFLLSAVRYIDME